MKFKLYNARLAFPQLFVAKQVNGEGEPAFSAALIISKATAAIYEGKRHPDAVAFIRKAFDTVGTEKWKAKWPIIKKELTTKDRFCLYDGDTKPDYAGFKGNMFVSARNKTRPTVFDIDKTPLTQADGRPYAGCYVVASVEIWAQDNKYGKRMNCSLRGVQFFKDGDAFAGGTPADADEFDDLSNTGDDDEPSGGGEEDYDDLA